MTPEEHAAYADLAQRYRCAYGMDLQTRLATQRDDITAWWRLGAGALAQVRWASLPERVRATIRTVAQERGVSATEIVGERQTARIADARLECYRRLRAMSWRGAHHPSLMQIGRWLDRDHTTIAKGLRP